MTVQMKPDRAWSALIIDDDPGVRQSLRLCLEAERSCDDAVVISEERADYAEQLVLLAQRMSATPLQPMLGMANRSDLSTRVTAVLDDRLERGRAGFTLAAGTIAAAALIVATVAPDTAMHVI